MHQCEAIYLPVYYVLGLEHVVDLLKSVIALGQNWLLEGEATDEPIEALDGQGKSFLLVVEEGSEVEITLEDLLIGHI